MPPIIRRSLALLGSALALLGVVFVAFRLHAYQAELDLSRISISAWAVISVLALAYGLANVLLSLAWWHLLRHLGVSTTRFGSIRLYGLSQLAKYVPGNIFHLAGRQALGMAKGMPAGALAKSTVWELALIAIAGALFGWLVLPLLVPGFPEVASVAILLVTVALAAQLLRTKTGTGVAWAFLWQILFLFCSGAIFVALLLLISGSNELGSAQWVTIAGAYVLAWLVGLVTPGAPAGVGVRELVLLFLLNGLVAETDLIMAVLLGRVVTVVGDLLFFIAVSVASTKSHLFEKKHV